MLSASPSAIRKLHDSITDPKYDGVRTSRKQLLEESDEDFTTDEEDADGPAASQEDEEGSSDALNEHEDSEDTDEDSPAPEGSDEEATPAPSDRLDGVSVNGVGSPPTGSTELNSDLASNLRKTREEDREKGKAVSRQIVRHSIQSRTR